MARHLSPWNVAFLMAVSVVLSGCARHSAPVPVVTADEQISPDALIIAGNQPWVDTGVDVVAGQPLTISAKGRVAITKLLKQMADAEREVGPSGTFFYDDRLTHIKFPLAAAGNGPAPCFCLIGRIGQGAPFYVGPGISWKPDRTGRLYLGINDFDPSKNVGDFFAEVKKPSDVQPVSYRHIVPEAAAGGEPVPGCQV
ncbi:MAG: hypothetical protein JSS02_22890, partial [Planctomycetes bacterium]|nr:hypothetical protein [Planctomycetota bacterium]